MEVQEEKQQQSISCVPPSQSAPWLVFYHGKGREKYQSFYSISEEKSYTRKISDMQYSYCKASPVGWLLLLDPLSKHCFLLNPITMVKIELPPMERAPTCYRSKYILSSLPTDSDCLVICADFKSRFLLFCHPRDKKWIKHEHDLDGAYLTDIVACNGKLYALTYYGEFAIMEFAPFPNITILEVKKPEEPAATYKSEWNLLESCGELFLIVRHFLLSTRTTYDLRVFKMDFSNNTWEAVDNIGDRVFFLGNNSCKDTLWSNCNCSASRSATEMGIKGNCIYFTKSGDKCLHVFDLDDRTESFDVPCPIRGPWSPPFWIMPSDVL